MRCHIPTIATHSGAALAVTAQVAFDFGPVPDRGFAR